MVVDTSDLNCADLYQLNMTDDVSRASTYLINPGSRAIALGIQVLALVIGVPGNISFLVAVAKVPYMRTITNIFLVNLAIADIIFVVYTATSYLLYLPAPVRSHIHSLLNVWCPAAFSISFLTYFTSVATVSLVSAQQYNAICRPLKHLVVNSKKRALKLVLGTWVVGLAFTSLSVLQYADPVRICVTWPDGNDTEKFTDLPDIIGFCLPLAPWALIVGNLAASVPFMISLVANTIMYVQIVRTLGDRPVTQATVGQTGLAPRARKIRNQVTRMVVTNSTVFFICQCPYACINFVYITGYIGGLSFLEVNELQNDLRIFSHGLLFLNSAVNPIIYYAMCPSYREAARKAFRCGTRKSVTLSTLTTNQ